MEDSRAEQKEALETLAEFNVRLLKNMKLVQKELSGERLDDTNAFLQDIINAMNWEIQVVNGTMELLNEDGEHINKKTFNDVILTLSDAVNTKDDAKMAEAFYAVIDQFEKLGERVNQIIS